MPTYRQPGNDCEYGEADHRTNQENEGSHAEASKFLDVTPICGPSLEMIPDTPD
jgi:hypothetical protein